MRIKKILISLVIVATLFAGFTVLAGSIVSEGPTQENTYRHYTFFENATSTTVSSDSTPTFDAQGRLDTGILDIAGAKKVTLYFSRGDEGGEGNTGQTVFDVDVSPDGTNWYDFNKLLGSDISSTATTTVTIGAATSTTVYSMDLGKDTFKSLRCTATVTTDGESDCKAFVEY